MDKQIRVAIKQIIKALYPVAQVFAWNALSHSLNEWPGLFRTTDGKTHGWIIKRAAARAEWKNPQRDRKTAIYDVWGFYGFSAGNENENSDNDFAVIVDAVYEAIKASPTLDVTGVERHGLLQIATNTTIDTGEETLHFAQGRLEVQLCC
jgi:hypothetical protein